MLRKKSLAREEYKPNEDDIAVAFIDFVSKKYPQYLADVVKIDNEGKTSWQLGKLKKRQGKRKGASDYFIAHASRKYYTDENGQPAEIVFFGLWLELKKHDGKESEEQRDFGERMFSNGYVYECVYSIDEAMAVFEEYMK